MSQRDKAERAVALYKAAVLHFKITRFNRTARAWAAAAVWIAADEGSLSTSTAELASHFRARFIRIRHCKIRLDRYTTDTSPAARIHNDMLDMVLDHIRELGDPQTSSSTSTSQTTLDTDDSDEEARLDRGALTTRPAQRDPSVPPLDAKNWPFVKKAQGSMPKIRKLATTLASRFTSRKVPSITSDAVFTSCCVLVAAEAVLRKRVPLLSNLAAILASTVCFGAAPATVASKYRLMLKWMQTTFLQIPWIPEDQKRPFQDEDQDAALASGRENMLQDIKIAKPKGGKKRPRTDAGNERSLVNKSGNRKAADLTRFFQEIIEFDPELYGRKRLELESDPEEQDEQAALCGQSEQVKPVDLRQFESIPPQDLRATPCLDSRQRKKRAIITQAQQALSRLSRGDDYRQAASQPEIAFESNVQHYLRLLLLGEQASHLAVSEELLHLPVAPFPGRTTASSTLRQRIARLLRQRQCTLDDLDVDNDLFLPGELESYLRTPEEAQQAARLALASGAFEKHDQKQEAAREKQYLLAQKEERARLRQGEKDRLALIAAGPGRIRQKRKRSEEEEDEAEEPAKQHGNNQLDQAQSDDEASDLDAIHDLSRADFDAVVASLSGVSSAAPFTPPAEPVRERLLS